MGITNSLIPLGKELAKQGSKELAKQAGKSIAKEAGKTLSRQVARQAAKAVGRELSAKVLAKEAGKRGAKGLEKALGRAVTETSVKAPRLPQKIRNDVLGLLPAPVEPRRYPLIAPVSPTNYILNRPLPTDLQDMAIFGGQSTPDVLSAERPALYNLLPYEARKLAGETYTVPDVGGQEYLPEIQPALPAEAIKPEVEVATPEPVQPMPPAVVEEQPVPPSVNKILTDEPQKSIETPNANVNAEDAQNFEEAKNIFNTMRDEFGNGGGAQPPKGGVEGFAVPAPEPSPIQPKAQTDIQAAPLKASKSTARQRGTRNKIELWANGFGSVPKDTRKRLYGKYKGAGSYPSVAERLMGRNIDPANVQSVVEAELEGMEAIKQGAMDYADNAGVKVDLSGVPQQLSLSKIQKQRLDELGLGLDDILGEGAAAIEPSRANSLYMTLRDMGVKLRKSQDPTFQLAGDACADVANKIAEAIDETMDAINYNYKTELMDLMTQAGDDPAVIRAIASDADFKFSDLRKEQAPFMVAKDLIGLKTPTSPTLNVMGIDTGLPNPFAAAGEKVREKYYDWQSSRKEPFIGGGATQGGEAGGGTARIDNGPVGYELRGLPTQPQQRPWRDLGLVGGGALIGSLLGGGRGQEAPQGGSFDALGGMQEQEAPMPVPTLGGYTREELEDAFVNAIEAGDGPAAQQLSTMIGMLDNKAQAYQEAAKPKAPAAVNSLRELYALFQQAGGGQRPLRGNFTNMMNFLTGGGYDPDANTYEQVKGTTSSSIIRALGEKGALSDRDREYIMRSMPNLTDDPEAAERKFQSLYRLLMGASK